MEGKDLEGAAYIVWVNYRSEGWQPHCINTDEELWTFITSGTHQPFVVTRGTITLSWAR